MAQHKHGGLFLRLAWHSGIALLDNFAAGTEAIASFCFHEIDCVVEQFLEGLIELLQP